ncbi:hypothetical protein ACFL4T_13195 [candidate division KSB1 bacterium]
MQVDISPPEQWDTTDQTYTSSHEYVVFASDLHMSDWSRGDDFMMGHNEGPVAPVNDKTALFACALMFAMRQAQQSGAPGVELVLNGDTIDLWEMIGRGTGFAHPGFLGLLNAFRQIPGNNIVAITGNHDWILPALPIWNVAAAYWNPVLETYATHGHQWDNLNNNPANPVCIGRNIAQIQGQIEPNPGSRFFNRPFPFCLIDNIKPLSYKQLSAFINNRLSGWGKLLKFFAVPRLIRRIANQLGPLVIEDNDDYLIKAANDIAAGRIIAPGLPAGAGPAKRIVFGHTHMPAFQIPYFNTASWTPMLAFTFIKRGRWPFRRQIATETLMDLNPQLHIYKNINIGRIVERMYYYNTAVPFGPGINPQQQTRLTVQALRRALGYR